MVATARRLAWAASGVVAVVIGGAVTAQTPAVRPPEALSWYGDPTAPNVSGVWARAETGAPAASKEGWAPWPPPLQGEFASTWTRRVAEAAAGTRTDDPVSACLPAGMPRFITGMNGPLLIVQTPGRVAMTRDYGPPRRIWLDGRALPPADDLEQFFSGNSVGRYDGRDLVVKTIGLKDEPIDGSGIPHSDQVTVEERYRRADAQTLVVSVTVTDKLALRLPLHTEMVYKAVTDPNWQLQDLTCVPRTAYHPELYVK